MDEALLEKVRGAADRAFAGGPVLAAYAFGSRVSGRALLGSDLDRYIFNTIVDENQ